MFEWDSATGANTYNFRYGLAGHVFREATVEVSMLTHELDVSEVIRGANYVWEVQGKNGATLGSWVIGEEFSVPTLPAPRMLRAVNTPFKGVEPDNGFGLSWDAVEEGGARGPQV